MDTDTGNDDYSLLKDLRLEIEEGEEGAFCLCFWVYLLNLTSFPATILRQVTRLPISLLPLSPAWITQFSNTLNHFLHSSI